MGAPASLSKRSPGFGILQSFGPPLYREPSHSALYSLREMRLPLLLAAVLLIVCYVNASFPAYGRAFSSFDELRNTRPTASGEVVYLLSHVAGLYKGGGQFVGTLSSGTNDYGMIASNGSAFHWDRIVEDYETLNVLHFGAVHDGVTDDQAAVLRMITWIYKQNTALIRNGVRFVEGKIYISPINMAATDRSDFALFGPTSPNGRGVYTQIISDGSSNPVFNVSTRRMTVRGIMWDGRVTATVDSEMRATGLSNVQPFFQNIETAGEFVNVESFYATRTGGWVFSIFDTIDTKFTNIVTNNTFSDFWNISWSNDPQGKWDHSTAVEVNNMYITNAYGQVENPLMTGMLSAPRMGQGLLRNIYISNCRNPGNFENSQWVIDNFYIENCVEAFNWRNDRDVSSGIVLRNATLQRGASTATWPSSAYEGGYIQTNNFAMNIRAPIAKLSRFSMIRGYNNVSTALWVNVGTFKTGSSDSGSWKILAVSRTDWRNATYTRPTANGAGGKTNIMLQRGPDGPTLTWSSQGYSAVTNVSYTDATDVSTTVWVEIAPWCGEYAFFVSGTGAYRTNTTHPPVNETSFFTKSGATSRTGPPAKATYAVNKASLHNGAAGWGAERGILTVDTTVNITLTPGQLAGHMILKVNGTNLATPYYHINPAITSSPTLTTTVAAGNRLSLSVTAVYSVSYQWQKGSGTTLTDIAGATASSYVVTAASSSDSGQYRVLCLGSEGRDTAAVSRIVTVTVA